MNTNAMQHQITDWILRTQMVNVARLDYPGADIVMRADYAAEYRFRVAACAKEPWTVEWIESIPEGGVLYDVGACVGSYALIAAARGVRTLAFEPSAANYARLVENANINHLLDRLTPFPVALSSRTGLGRLEHNYMMPGSSGHVFQPLDGSPETPLRHASTATQLVLSYRMDDLPRLDPQIPPPTHIKLDVDGAEAAVLRGARGVIARPEFHSLLIEMHSYQEKELTDLAEAAGLRMARRFDTSSSAWQRSDLAYAVFERSP